MSSGSKEKRKSSIETEPRALSLSELNEAREAAMYVLNTKTWDEAIDIFTKGLKPVQINKLSERLEDNDDDDGEDEEEESMLHRTIAAGCRRRNWRRCYKGNIVKKDMVTAPF